MEGSAKILTKLSEIEQLLFILSVVELRKSGFSQGAIAKMLKASKTTINALLKNVKIGEEEDKNGQRNK